MITLLHRRRRISNVTQQTPEPPSTHGNGQLHTEQFPLREILYLPQCLLHTWWVRKYTEMGRKGVNPTPNTAPYSQKGTPNSQLFPEESRVFTVPITLQLLRLPLRDGPPKYLALKAYTTYIHESHRTAAMKAAALKWAREHAPRLLPGLSVEWAGKNSQSSQEEIWPYIL